MDEADRLCCSCTYKADERTGAEARRSGGTAACGSAIGSELRTAEAAAEEMDETDRDGEEDGSAPGGGDDGR